MHVYIYRRIQQGSSACKMTMRVFTQENPHKTGWHTPSAHK